MGCGGFVPRGTVLVVLRLLAVLLFIPLGLLVIPALIAVSAWKEAEGGGLVQQIWAASAVLLFFLVLIVLGVMFSGDGASCAVEWCQ